MSELWFVLYILTGFGQVSSCERQLISAWIPTTYLIDRTFFLYARKIARSSRARLYAIAGLGVDTWTPPSS
jgi:hypothetical protein